MNIRRTLGILTLIAASSSSALAEEATGNRQASAPLPSLPLFELPTQASDTARQHVGLAHARRDSRRAEHTRRQLAVATSRKKTAQRHLEAARERQAAAQARRDAAQLRRTEAQDRRAAAAAERQVNLEARRAAAAERRANAGRK